MAKLRAASQRSTPASPFSGNNPCRKSKHRPLTTQDRSGCQLRRTSAIEFYPSDVHWSQDIEFPPSFGATQQSIEAEIELGVDSSMTTKTYAILDTHAVGPAEEIDQGGEVVTCTVDGADIHRMIRGTIGFSSGLHYFEFTAFGEGTIAGKVSGGICTDASSLSTYVGEEATSIGFKIGDGDIWSGNTSILTVPASTTKITVGVLLDADNSKVTFFVANTAYGPITITSGQTWYPAVGCGSDVAAGDISVWFVSGANAFAFPQDGNPGWFTETQGFGQLRVCAQTGFLTASGDTPANTAYSPDMLEFDQFSTKRSCSVWTWANQSSGASFGTAALKNDRGTYDFMQKTDPRDAIVTVRMTPVGGTFADSFVIATAVVNAIASDGEQINRVTLGDTLATIQRALQTKKFPPWADSGIANRPYPILLGACRQVKPLLFDEASRTYQIADASINNVGVLRDQGDPLDPNATPPDYVLSQDLQQVIPNVLPVGAFTGDFSSVGQQNVIAGASDILAGAGLFTTWSNPSNPPDGWTAVAGSAGSRVRETTPQNYVCRLITSDPWDPDGSGKIGQGIKIAAGLVPGKTYNLTFKVSAASGTIPQDPSINLWYGLRFVTALTNAASANITPVRGAIRQPMWQGDLAYTLTYTVPPGATGDLYAVVSASTNGSPDSSTGTAFVDFYGLRIEEVAQNVTEVPLQPMKLATFMKNIIEQRAGLTSADWVEQDAIDIDTRTGYDGIGWYETEPVTIEAALRAATDSYCSVILTDHLGRIRVRQLIDPDTIDDGDIVIELDDKSIAYPMNCTVDAATGLTTSMLSRKNNYVSTDTDFISDTTASGLPYALRTRFKQDGQFLSVATVPLAGYYAFATQAPPVLSLFDNPDNAQTEINRVNSLYSTTPNFYTFTVYFNGMNAQTLARLIFGDGIKVTYPRYGLDDGKKMIVVDANIIPGDFRIEITAWRPST